MSPSIHRIPTVATKTKPASSCMKGVEIPSIRRIQKRASPFIKGMERPILHRILTAVTKTKQTRSFMKGMVSPSLHIILVWEAGTNPASLTQAILAESHGCESQYDIKQNMKKAFELHNASKSTISHGNLKLSATLTGTASVISNRNPRKDMAAARRNTDREKEIFNRIPNKDGATSYHPDIIPNSDKPSSATRSHIIDDRELTECHNTVTSNNIKSQCPAETTTKHRHK